MGSVPTVHMTYHPDKNHYNSIRLASDPGYAGALTEFQIGPHSTPFKLKKGDEKVESTE
jgi:hypothetical protein